MKLVDAMEKGSKNVRHIAGTRNNEMGARCAIGMAEWAVQDCRIENAWPWTTQQGIELPCGCTGHQMGSGCITQDFRDGKNVGFLSGIVHLFNYHVMTKKDWSMDRLLKWVGCVEENREELAAK